MNYSVDSGAKIHVNIMELLVQEEINKIWGGFLKDGSKQFKHETDDKTMILAVRVPDENLN